MPNAIKTQRDGLIANESVLPRRAPIAPIYYPDLDQYYKLTPGTEEQREFRNKELQYLQEKTRELANSDFEGQLEAEIERLAPYYDAVAELFGIDFRAMAATRTRISEVLMDSSIVIIQSMLEEELEKVSGQVVEKGKDFFQSAVSSAEVKFNANSQVVIDGHPFVFSVLATPEKDETGEFVVDHPAYSLSRDVFSNLLAWQKSQTGDPDLSKCKLLEVGADLFSKRVHDWLHQSVIYDKSGPLTKAFQNWSENSFFVKHLYDDAGMINYELISAYIHFRIYQKIFEENPGSKQEVINQTTEYLGQVEAFANWMETSSGKDRSEAQGLANYLTYIAIRGVFDVISFEDPDLVDAMKDLPRFEMVKLKMPEKYHSWLKGIYDTAPKQVPFRMGEEKELSVDDILKEYLSGLYDEAMRARDLSQKTALLLDRNIDRPLAREFSRLPKTISDQFRDFKVSDVDPRVFQILNQTLEKIMEDFGEKIFSDFVRRLKIDTEGNFYFEIDRNEINLERGTEVTQRKRSILVQVPWDSKEEKELILKRTSNLLSQQEGARASAKPGDVILVNIQNGAIARSILDQSKDANGKIDVGKFLETLGKFFKKGLVDLADSYPYDPMKAIATFDLRNKKAVSLEGGHDVIEPGYYETKPNVRTAWRTDGPISVDGPNGDRRRVLKGALILNHLQIGDSTDIFPVFYRNFDRFYRPTKRTELHPFTVNKAYLDKAGVDGSGEDVSRAIEQLLSGLQLANDLNINGPRGKKFDTTFSEVLNAAV